MKSLLSGLRRRQKIRRNSDGPVWVVFLVGPQQSGDDSLGPSPGAVCPGKLLRRSAGNHIACREDRFGGSCAGILAFSSFPSHYPALTAFLSPSELQRLFERRNWTPQAMLYLKGARESQTLYSLHRVDGRHPGNPGSHRAGA